MLDGWLVVNGFLKSDKFSRLYDWLLAAAHDHGIKLQLRYNYEILIELQDGPDDKGYPAFAIFWDKDIFLAKYLEQKGMRLFNPAEAIELCDDKRRTHLFLHRAGLRQPRTIIAPMTYDNIGYSHDKFLDQIINTLGLPLVIKHSVGSFGGQVFLADTKQKAREIITAANGRGCLFQEYIAASAGSDLRLQVVGGRVIGAMKRSGQAGEFRANLTLGGKMEKWTPDEKQEELAVAACAALGLDFAGVDLLLAANDEALICEVNSNAHFQTLYECTGVDTAAAIMKHVKFVLMGA